MNSYGTTPPPKPGGSSTLYIIVFFLCVISAMAGYFYFKQTTTATASQKELEALKARSDAQLKELQTKTEQDIKNAASELEKASILEKANIDAAKLKFETQAKAQQEALAAKEAAGAASIQAQQEALKRAQAKIDSDMAAATQAVREATALKSAATQVKADADIKQRQADEAMQNAQNTNDANLRAIAQEKSRIAAEAAAKVADADRRANEALNAARAEAQRVIDLNNRLQAVTANNAQLQTELASTVTKARYIRLKANGEYINIADVAVATSFDNPNAIIRAIGISDSTPPHEAGPYRHLYDGNPNTFGHTAGNGNEHVDLDFGKEIDMKAILILNRTDCCQERILKMRVELFNGAGQPFRELPPFQVVAQVYIIDPSSKLPVWVSHGEIKQAPQQAVAVQAQPPPQQAVAIQSAQPIGQFQGYSLIQGDIDYPGGDIFHLHPGSNPVANQDNCLNVCRANRACDMVVFNNAKNLCWGKVASTDRSSVGDRVSYVKDRPSVFLYFTELSCPIMLHAEGYAATKEQITVQNIPSGWTWERFRVVRLPNNQVAFHSTVHNRFLRMNATTKRLDASSPCNWNQMPPEWSWERFTIKRKNNKTYIIASGAGNLILSTAGPSTKIDGLDTLIPNGTELSKHQWLEIIDAP